MFTDDQKQVGLWSITTYLEIQMDINQLPSCDDKRSVCCIPSMFVTATGSKADRKRSFNFVRFKTLLVVLCFLSRLCRAFTNTSLIPTHIEQLRLNICAKFQRYMKTTDLKFYMQVCILKYYHWSFEQKQNIKEGRNRKWAIYEIIKTLKYLKMWGFFLSGTP